MMQSTVVTCMGWALAQPMSRMEQGMLMKKKLTSNSHDITWNSPVPRFNMTIRATLKPGFDKCMMMMMMIIEECHTSVRKLLLVVSARHS